MQFQSDILDVEVERPTIIETTALGAAYLAGLAIGYWKDKNQIKENRQTDRRFNSNMNYETRNYLIKKWHKAVKRTMLWEHESED